jgi:hypothetical protein
MLYATHKKTEQYEEDRYEKKPSLVTPKCVVLKVNKSVVMKTGVIPVTYCENKRALMTKWRES